MKRFTYILCIILFLEVEQLTAQIPYHAPNPSKNSPLNFDNPADIILYIVIPAIAVILGYVAWRRKKKR